MPAAFLYRRCNLNHHKGSSLHTGDQPAVRLCRMGSGRVYQSRHRGRSPSRDLNPHSSRNPDSLPAQQAPGRTRTDDLTGLAMRSIRLSYGGLLFRAVRMQPEGWGLYGTGCRTRTGDIRFWRPTLYQLS